MGLDWSEVELSLRSARANWHRSTHRMWQDPPNALRLGGHLDSAPLTALSYLEYLWVVLRVDDLNVVFARASDTRSTHIFLLAPCLETASRALTPPGPPNSLPSPT